MALVIGHRGARGLAAENTLGGIRAAALAGADWVELDVRISSDGELILMHDELVQRTTSGQGKVEDLTVEELNLLHTKDGQKIPTLKEAVALSKELGLGLVAEMKDEGIEEPVAGVLEACNCRCMVTSFYHTSLREIADLSDIKTGIIISSLPIRPVKLALWAEADAIFPERVSPRLFKEAHQQNLSVYPWIVNSKEEASWLLRLGADGLVTDVPDLIRQVADEPLQATGKANCQYYPCHHFALQDCTHCFCPLYPCKDEELGRFVKTKKGKRFWSCIDCKLVHHPKIAKYLADHPETSVSELKILKDTMDC
ncbi:Glycerophosphoryl diester phosphodiesterase family protein [uncultured archaeon]|nr:Glycerophosphoryl diester phosphodiesterase family protein [uncultured archaeon]